MTNILRTISLLISAILCAGAVNAAVETNIVIEQVDQQFKFIPSSDGSLERIETSTRYTFRARRTKDVAHAVEYYHDFIKITKASGGDVSYDYVDNNGIFFSDNKACSVAVELNKPGAKGKAQINTNILKPEFLTTILIAESYDIENATYTFEIPESLARRYSIVTRNVPDGMLTRTEERKGNKLIITFAAADLRRPIISDHSPSPGFYLPQLVILGHFADVDDLYRYLRAYVDPVDPQPQTVVEKTREVTSGCTTDAQRIAAISDFVHKNIRYVAVENGDLSHRPDHPSEVLRKAYGDCKGSASLIKAMLCAAGIDGRLVWIGTEGISHTFTDHPNTSGGNHMIAAAMTGDSLLFIDGTSRSIPPFQVPIGDQDCVAIVEDTPHKCMLVTVPATDPAFNATIIDLRLRPTADGALRGEGTTRFTNGMATAIRSIMDDIKPASRPEKYARIFELGIKGSRAEHPEVTDNTTDIQIKGAMTISGAVKSVAGETFYDLNPSQHIALMKFDLKDREAPGKIMAFTSTFVNMSLEIPEGMQPSFIPEPVAVDNQWLTGSVETSLTPGGDAIERRFKVLLKKRIVDTADLKKFNSDLTKLISACSSKVGLKPITD